MTQCDRCGGSVGTSGEWVEVRHHHANMTFGSGFCSASCAAAYLDDGLEAELDPQAGVGGEGESG